MFYTTNVNLRKAFLNHNLSQVVTELLKLNSVDKDIYFNFEGEASHDYFMRAEFVIEKWFYNIELHSSFILFDHEKELYSKNSESFLEFCKLNNIPYIKRYISYITGEYKTIKMFLESKCKIL